MATNSKQAYSNLQAAQKSAQTPEALLNYQNQVLGTDAARNTVTGLRTSVDNTTKLLQQVAPSVMGRTQGSLVTSAQAGRQIQNEQAPISQDLSKFTQEYGRASEDLNSLQSRAAQLSQLAYQGQQDKISTAQNLYNILYGKEQDAIKRKDALKAQKAAQKTADKQFKESVRQFNVSQANRSSGGGSSSSKASSSGYYTKSNKAGGVTFYNPKGKAITAAQYFAGQGGTSGDLLNFLKKDKDKGSQTAYQYAVKNGVSAAKKKYPWIFGGV